jgi:transcriptional regulator with XRE-family HTH domain
MIKRIKTLISAKNLSASQFADLLGVQRSNISHILSGRNKPSLDFILRIVEVYPSVNLEWLLKGQGEMLVGIEKKAKEIPTQLDFALDTELNQEHSTPIHLFAEEEEKDDLENARHSALKKSAQNVSAAEDEEPAVYPSIARGNKSEVEQIVLLNRDGSFKIYTSGK